MKVSLSDESTADRKVLPCPVETTLDVIGGKWKAVILFHLCRRGTLRFAELRRKIPGVSERVLAQHLREFEREGIVHREAYAVIPPKVEYSVTEYGTTLKPIREAMCEWGLKHAKRTLASRSPG